MSPEEIKTIIETTIQNQIKGFWVYIILSVILSLATVSLTKYFETKSENIATKQDIEELTKKIEKAKRGQELINIKIKELYDKTISYKRNILEFKNDPKLTTKKVENFLTETRTLLFAINSDAIFKEELKKESENIEKEYNIWVNVWEKRSKEKSTNFELDNTDKSVNIIQEKILAL